MATMNRVSCDESDDEEETKGAGMFTECKSIYYQHSNKIFCILFLLVFAILVPTLVFIFVYTQEIEDLQHTCNILQNYRIPCGLSNTTSIQCTDINCCYNEKTKNCYHTLPSKYQYKSTDKDWKNGFEPLLSVSPFKHKNSEKIYLNYDNKNNEILSFDLNDKQYIYARNIDVQNEKYVVDITTNEMGVEVRRNNKNKDLILTTNNGPTILSDKYWEWSLDLNTDNLYGLDQFRLIDNKTLTLVLYPNDKNHGILPKFMAELNGLFHGVYIEHYGPLEITVLPSKLIILRMLSGEYVRVHLSLGPTPSDIWRQQGVPYIVPPYWMLGAHICRDTALPTNILDYLNKLEAFLDQAKTKNIPFESHCIHEKLFTLTYNENTVISDKIKVIIDKLKTDKKRFIMSLPPQIEVNRNSEVYNKAVEQGILYKNADGSVLTSGYNGKSAAYPDYQNNNTMVWLDESLTKLTTTIGVPEAFVLRDNWPKSEVNKIDKSEFQYLSQDLEDALSNTIPWNAQTSTNQSHLSQHNSYGFYQLKAISELQKTSYFLSASQTKENTYGNHIQNIDISWVNFKQMIKATLSASLFGTPMFSVPICGTQRLKSVEMNTSQEKICLKWYQASLSLPMLRISSDDPSRDPFSLISQNLMQIAEKAIKERYRLLPYYYTILSENGPLVRPMVFDFYADNNTFNLDEQYMVGKQLLVAHPVYSDAASLKIYLPNIPGGWFEYWGGTTFGTSGWNKISIVEKDFVIFLAAGSIIPMHYNIDFALQTTADDIRQNVPITVTIVPDTKGEATGSWTIKDNKTVSLKYKANVLTIGNLKQIKETICQPTSVNDVHTSLDPAARVYVNNQISTCNLDNVNLDLCTATDDVMDVQVTC